MQNLCSTFINRTNCLTICKQHRSYRYKTGTFEVSTEFPGLPVEYSVNNGDTWLKILSSLLIANESSQSTSYLFVTRLARSQLFLEIR